jgi:hypothetical protein
MTKTMTIQEAIEYIKNENTNDDFAFRGDDEPEFNLGGVSAIKVNAYGEQYVREAANTAKRYGKNLFLLQGYAINAHEWANDPGECLMTEHKIVGIING